MDNEAHQPGRLTMQLVCGVRDWLKLVDNGLVVLATVPRTVDVVTAATIEDERLGGVDEMAFASIVEIVVFEDDRLGDATVLFGDRLVLENVLGEVDKG
jgi:hypothetical protein